MATPNKQDARLAALEAQLFPQGTTNEPDVPLQAMGIPPLVQTYRENGKLVLRYNLHEGQLRAWNSTKRIVAIVAGKRSGKTSCGALLLLREIEEAAEKARLKGKEPATDYLVVAPTFPLLNKSAMPEVEMLFHKIRGLGKITKSPSPMFIFSDFGAKEMWGYVPPKPIRVLFGYAENPESLEAMTAGAAWLDEAGQSKFRLGSWQTIQQRVSIHEGRIFITTTPYAMASWLKHKIVDPWQSEKDKGREHPEIDLIRFSSAMNPVYPLQELEKAKRDLPAWKYRMNHEGEFERPAGMVYDCWEELRNACARFPVPPAWPRHAGLDFGGVNTAAVFLAEELDGVGLKTGRFFAYRVYNPKKSKTAAQHVLDILAEEPGNPSCYGGHVSENQWRNEFHQAGLPVRVPRLRETLNTHASVEVGINRVYAMLKNCRLIVFSDLEELTEEFESYARVLDDFSRPTEEIADKGDYHLMDATRYVCSELSDTSEARAVIIGGDNPEMRRQFEEKMKQEAERDQKEKIQEEIHWLLREENWPSWKAWGNQFEEEYR